MKRNLNVFLKSDDRSIKKHLIWRSFSQKHTV